MGSAAPSRGTSNLTYALLAGGVIVGAIFGFVASVLTNRFRVVADLVNPLAVTVAAIRPNTMASVSPPPCSIAFISNSRKAVDKDISTLIEKIIHD